MSSHPDASLGPDGSGQVPPPDSAWRHLRGWMAVLGVLFMLFGGVSLSFTCCVGGIVWLFWDMRLPVGLLDGVALYGLLLVAWAVTPAGCGILLLRGADRLARRPPGESAVFLVVAAAAAFVGLAWVAVTTALLLGGQPP
jgi:hypothetical protein